MAASHDFDTFFEEVFPRLVSLGALRTGRVDIARELAQETMLRAHERWEALATYDFPAAWCHTVMTNLLIDHHRSKQSEQRAVDRLATGSSDADLPHQALAEWNELVEPLTVHQRTVVTLYYADDLSVTQIAHLLGTTRGAVKATLFKARRSVRRHVNGDDDGGPDG